MTGSAPSGAMDVLLGVASRREGYKEGVWGRKGWKIHPECRLADLFFSFFWLLLGLPKSTPKTTPKWCAKVSPGLPKWTQNVSQNHKKMWKSGYGKMFAKTDAKSVLFWGVKLAKTIKNIVFSMFFKVSPLLQNAWKLIQNWSQNRWKIYEKPIPRGCQNHVSENAAKINEKVSPRPPK